MNYSLALKKNGKRLKNIFSVLISVILSISILCFSVSAKTVTVDELPTLFEYLRVRTYDNFWDGNFEWADVYHRDLGSWSGIYLDSLSAEIVHQSSFDQTIVEDDLKVMALLLAGQLPVQTLRAGSTLDVELTLTFPEPIDHFQPTQCLYLLYANKFVNGEWEYITYDSSLVEGEWVSTEGYEEYYGDVTEAFDAHIVNLELHYTPEVDTEVYFHGIQFLKTNNGQYDYQYTNDFHVNFEEISFRYVDEESEIIAAIDQSTLKLMQALSPDRNAPLLEGDFFQILEDSESNLIDDATEGLNQFSGVIGALDLGSGTQLYKCIKFLSSFSQEFIEKTSLSTLLGWLIAIGGSGLILSASVSIGGKIFSKSNKNKPNGKKLKETNKGD